MAYFNSSGGHRNFTTGAAVPFKMPTAIYCDGCAEAAIPLAGKPGDIGRHWETGFKWAPHYGAPCTDCGTPC